VTGILAITVICPTVIGLVILVSLPIGHIFVAAPMAFLISVAFLIGNVTLRKYGAIIWLTSPALLLITVCVALPIYWNRPLIAELANLAQGDNRQNEYKFATKSLHSLFLTLVRRPTQSQPIASISVNGCFSTGVRPSSWNRRRLTATIAWCVTGSSVGRPVLQSTFRPSANGPMRCTGAHYR